MQPHAVNTFVKRSSQRSFKYVSVTKTLQGGIIKCSMCHWFRRATWYEIFWVVLNHFWSNIFWGNWGEFQTNSPYFSWSKFVKRSACIRSFNESINDWADLKNINGRNSCTCLTISMRFSVVGKSTIWEFLGKSVSRLNILLQNFLARSFKLVVQIDDLAWALKIWIQWPIL